MAAIGLRWAPQDHLAPVTSPEPATRTSPRGPELPRRPISKPHRHAGPGMMCVTPGPPVVTSISGPRASSTPIA